MQKTFIQKSIAIFSILVLFLLAGCSKKEDRVSIQFSSWGSESETAIIKPILKEFERENPDIRVEFIHIPKNYFQKLHLLVASRLTPDVVFLNNLNGPVYAENDVFLDLSGYLGKDRVISEKDFFPRALQGFKYKNKLYAIPRDISNLVIYYNKDVFDKYKVPYPDDSWTYGDFLLTAKKLTKDTNNDGKTDLYGIGFEKLPLFWLPFLWSESGGVISSDLKSSMIDQEASLKGIQFYADLRSKYHVAPTASEAGSATMAQLFMQGKIAMQVNGRWSVPRYRKDLEFRWDIARFPRGTKGSVVDADTSGWAISKSSKHPDEAWKLVRFLASKQACQAFTKSGLVVPARIDVANSNLFLDKANNPQHSRLFIDIIPESMPTPANENYQEIMDIVTIALEPVFDGKKPANEAITPKLIESIKELLR